MAQWYETAYGLQYADPEDVASWGGGTLVPSYTSQQGEQYQWSPELVGREGWQAPSATVPSGSYLLELLDKQASGQPLSLADQSKLEDVLRGSAVPTRDWRAMMMPGSPDYQDTDRARYPGITDPDYLAMVQQVHAAAQQGDPQARALLPELRKFQEFATYNATRKEDAFSPLGDPFFGALGILGLGASAGAIAPLFAGGAGLGTTLGSLGALAGTAGQGASVLGEALDVPGLRQAGDYLGALGGLAGGFGGLANLWGTGVQSLSDAAKLAQSAGRITGAVGRASGSDVLGQASRYLGYAGQLGNVGSGLLPASVTDWSGTNSPLAGVAPQIGPHNVSNLLSAADVATQRGGGNMSEWDWGEGPLLSNAAPDLFGGSSSSSGAYDYGGYGYDPGPWLSNAAPSLDYSGWSAGGPGSFGGQVMTDYANGPDDTGGGGGGSSWLSTLLGGAGGLAKSLFGGAGGGIAGPLLSSLGSLGRGAIGSNAANEAARLQAAALNRGIDLQTAQWLQQQGNLAPYLQAGQQGLATLQGLAGREQPGLPTAPAAISGANYALPDTTPGWNPQAYNGPQGPNAMDYRYSAPATVNPATYAWNPQAAMDPSQFAFSAPNGQELLARDPGYQFRQEEARKAIDASAAARGGLLSGSTLGALQRQSQDLASQEYGQAYGRALGENQLRYGRGLTQTQEDYQRQLAANQLGYGRATEQQQLGYQQGLGAQGFNWQTALQGQQNQFNQGLQAQQWNQRQAQQYETDMYTRALEQQKLRYGMDVSQQGTDYERQQALYKQQLAQFLLPWEQASTLANLGGQATGMYGSQGGAATRGISELLGQLGSAQGTGSYGSGLSWMNALTGAGNQIAPLLRGLNA